MIKKVFADTNYWIAISYSKDALHAAAIQARKSLGDITLVTTEEILTEFLNAFSKSSILREKAGLLVHLIQDDPNVEIIEQSRESFQQGFALYESRLDKQYSLTDCISMSTMRTWTIQEILTSDHHFQQEGFIPLY